MRSFVPILKLNPTPIQKFILSSLMLLTATVAADIVPHSSLKVGTLLPQIYQGVFNLKAYPFVAEKIKPVVMTVDSHRVQLPSYSRTVSPTLGNHITFPEPNILTPTATLIPDFKVLKLEPFAKIFFRKSSINTLQFNAYAHLPVSTPFVLMTLSFSFPEEIECLEVSFIPLARANLEDTALPLFQKFKATAKALTHPSLAQADFTSLPPLKQSSPPPAAPGPDLDPDLDDASAGDESNDDQPLLMRLIGRRPLSLIEDIKGEKDFAANPYKIALVDTLKKNMDTDGFLGVIWLSPELTDQRLNFIGNYLVKVENVFYNYGGTLAPSTCKGTKLCGLATEFQLKLPIFVNPDMVDEALDLLHKLKLITPDDEHFIFF